MGMMRYQKRREACATRKAFSKVNNGKYSYPEPATNLQGNKKPYCKLTATDKSYTGIGTKYKILATSGNKDKGSNSGMLLEVVTPVSIPQENNIRQVNEGKQARTAEKSTKTK